MQLYTYNYISYYGARSTLIQISQFAPLNCNTTNFALKLIFYTYGTNCRFRWRWLVRLEHVDNHHLVGSRLITGSPSKDRTSRTIVGAKKSHDELAPSSLIFGSQWSIRSRWSTSSVMVVICEVNDCRNSLLPLWDFSRLFT